MHSGIPPDVFISILTDLLAHHRDRRARDLAHQGRDRMPGLPRHPFAGTAPGPRRGRPHDSPATETPDCVSFFSATFKGMTP